MATGRNMATSATILNHWRKPRNGPGLLQSFHPLVTFRFPSPSSPISHRDKQSRVSRVPGVKGQARTSMQKRSSCLKFPVWWLQLSFVLPVALHMSTYSCTCTHLDTNTHTRTHKGAQKAGGWGVFLWRIFYSLPSYWHRWRPQPHLSWYMLWLKRADIFLSAPQSCVAHACLV